MDTDIQQLLKPEILNSVEGLELLAKIIVEGYHSGANKSNRVALDQEFSQYRSYQPGDDLRLLDWKTYARSERFYIKQSEMQTDMTVKFIVDCSASMLHEDQSISKIQWVRLMIATLGYLTINQRDRLGLFTMNDVRYQEVSPGFDLIHFQRLLYHLLTIDPEGQWPRETNELNSFIQTGQKELVVFVTDFYERDIEITRFIESLKTQRNEVLVFHIVAENETELNYEQATTFEDLETKRKIQINPLQAKNKYKEMLNERFKNIKEKCLSLSITYDQFMINQPMDKIISGFLLKRKLLI